MCPKCNNFKSDVLYTRQLRDTTLVSTGGGAALIPPMVIEAVLIGVMGLGRRLLGK